ncbi:PhzF family phenazine biosynthesis protein [Micromonospora sp. NPDC049559]|uniref:PhzF family phenazine biosynthesis protein n=1 Tax=Micromonospora sp. NPDC049559 TaxID=3155923 RepID=UPI00341803DB
MAVAPGGTRRGGRPMTGAELHVVDAFTDTPFAGNPAGVVLLDGARTDAWMQSVAAELRHSETAFVGPVRPDGTRSLRWFTPVTEVALCGHATLATAHVLAADCVFETLSGELRCAVGAGGWIELDFPADPAVPLDPGPELREALPGADLVAAGRGVSDVLVQVGSAAQVRQLRPDLAALARVPARGIIVTAAAEATGGADGGDSDIVSRCFYPSVGVPEDPVTGSAHCTLASWWSPRLGRDELRAEQASPRGGRLRTRLRGDRVTLAGQAVTVVRGTLVG